MATISDPTRHDPEPGQQHGERGERSADEEPSPIRAPSWLERIPAPAFGLRVAEELPAALHYSIVVVDIVGFSDQRRNNSNQVRIRRGLYGALRHAFDAAEISWDRCRTEDRGDGALILVPADIPKARFVERLPEALADALGAHNKHHPAEEQIRLRLSLHAGEIFHDEHGVTSSSINHAFRILDAAEFKTAFEESAGVLAVISSGWFYDEVIRHCDSGRGDAYVGIKVTNKETTTRAWIRVVQQRRVRRREPRPFQLHQRRRQAQ